MPPWCWCRSVHCPSHEWFCSGHVRMPMGACKCYHCGAAIWPYNTCWPIAGLRHWDYVHSNRFAIGTMSLGPASMGSRRNWRRPPGSRPLHGTIPGIRTAINSWRCNTWNRKNQSRSIFRMPCERTRLPVLCCPIEEQLCIIVLTAVMNAFSQMNNSCLWCLFVLSSLALFLFFSLVYLLDGNTNRRLWICNAKNKKKQKLFSTYFLLLLWIVINIIERMLTTLCIDRYSVHCSLCSHMWIIFKQFSPEKWLLNLLSPVNILPSCLRQ